MSTSGWAESLSPDGKLLDNFAITESHRIINLVNAPSPAATAALAIGETVSGMILSQLNTPSK